MFSRTLLVALCIVYATPLTPLSSQGDDDCALYLTGPGRSSAYDYSLNLLKGNFAYDGQHTCITYEAINQAYLDARTRILVSQPKGDWKAENFASVGELLLDVSISLARIYGLTYEEIEKGLPLIDTSRTLIREVCPPVFSHVECRAGKYRRLDGLCNNLRHPTWGATMAPFQRLIGPLFADGINAPRISHTGRDLPLSRVVSRTMHPDDGFHDHAGTVMVIAWGQFMDHDYTLTGTPLDPVNRNDPEECCKRPPHLKHPYCNEIRVPDDDYFYRLFGVKCIDFVRGFPSPRPGCRLGSRAPFNTLTGAIDGNTVYGVTEKFARKLRTGYGGLLRMNPVFKEYGLKDLLPLKLDIPDEGCTRPNKNMFCFEAGEIRVNEQLVLTVMHTLMAREHNRVAVALATVNPHWDDETLFQESRRINIAEIQHITYNEFLPILLGKDVMEKFGLVLEKEGYWDGYDQNVNPDVIASFAAAAYRFGHSLLPTAVERWSKAHKFIASKRLSDLIRRPYDLYRAGVLDEYVMGLMNQVAQAMDDSITQEVTNHLFKKVGARFGMDLVSFNMQRGREFGLPGYMEFRKFCGLSGAETFQDLFGSMANETIQKYESIFEHPIDVDLWSGGVSERPLPGSMLGPTFACIIATQFSYSRRGDRFWFELPNQPSSFTPEQIVELRKARLARVICDNTDIIDTVQLYPMVLPDHELNPRVPCRSGIIPSMDFSKWAEPTPFVGGAKEYMTDAHICNKTEDNKNMTTENDDCTTDDAAYEFLEQEDCNNDDNVAKKNDKDKQNDTESNTERKTSINYEQNCENGSKNLTTKLSNPVKNSDTVLKYVYKNTDINDNKKTRGHVKNSLKRKKRSLISDSENQAHRYPQKFQINDHTDREEIAVPPTNAQGIINRDDLADFNIETLHDNIKPAINILMKDSQGFVSNLKQNHHIKNYGNDENENNEHEDKSDINIKSTFDNDNGPTKYNKKSKKVKSESIAKDRSNLSKSGKNNEHAKHEQKNIKTDRYNKDIINDDYIDESLSAENNDNGYIENSTEKLLQEVEDESSEYILKDIRNRKSDTFSEDDRRKVHTKIPKSYNNKRNEYEIKDSRKIKSDTFSKEHRRDDYSKDPKNENIESNEYEIKDIRNISNDSFNKDESRNDYTKESKNDYNDSNEYEMKDSRNLNNDSFNKDDRHKDYKKEPKIDNDESVEYEMKNSRNIKSVSFNKDDRRSDYTKEHENDKNESNEYDIKDSRNIKNVFFNKDDRRNHYTKEPKNDSNENNEYELNDKININSDFFKEDKRNHTKESNNDEIESNEEEVKDTENINVSDDENYKRNKQYVNIGGDKKSERSEEYLTDSKGTLNSDESLEADSIEQNIPTPRNNVINKNLGLFTKQHINNNSEINSNGHSKETSYDSSEYVNDIDKSKLLKKDTEGFLSANKKQNNSINFKEVDLDDFSYESIQNEKEQSITPIINLNKSNESNSLPEHVAVIRNTLEKPFTRTNSNQLPLVKNEKQIKINIDEIKPVIELNRSESQSEEESKEYKESDQAEDKEESINDRLRRVIEKSHKLHPISKALYEKENTDVKAQFERIPENYIHTDVKTNTSEKKPVVENVDEEGTLDTLAPNNYEYDKDLNIKFSDLTIKLPEIKLPKDILGFAPEESKNHKEDYDNSEDREKDNSEKKERDTSEDTESEEETEDDEESEEYNKEPKIHRNNIENQEDFYESYFNLPSVLHGDNPQTKDKYSSFHNEKSGEDLYEKFVRERFGKRNELKQRSEKLIEYEPISKNYNLFKTVRKALKRANKIEKNAEKSKDPNYMWTLEYGGKL